MRISCALVAAAALAASGCTMLESGRAAMDGEELDLHPNDPFEIENRFVYNVNSAIDRTVLEPAARAYVATAPEPVQSCVSNFFSNLGEPVNAVSHALAFNRESASQSVSRFLMNTVVGAAGCVDVADEAGLEEREADLGLAVRSWGDTDYENDSSLYLVVPILGPTTPVDGAGSFVGRSYVHPFNFPYGKREDGEETRSEFARLNPYGMRERSERNIADGLDGFHTRVELLDATDLVREVALDEYSFVRDAYLEQRAGGAGDLRDED